jgi:hypothetical protein
LARQQQPGYILPFLYVLQSVSVGADHEADASRAMFRQQLQAAVAAAAAQGLLNTDSTSDGGTQSEEAGSDESEDEIVKESEGLGQGADAAAAARFFKHRLKKKGREDPGMARHTSGHKPQSQQQQQQHQTKTDRSSAAAAAAAGAADGKLEVPVLPSGRKLKLAPAQLEDLELSWRRAYSAGTLAAAAVDAAAPLLLQRNLRCAVLAVQVLNGSLLALAAATQAVELEDQMFERLVDRGPDAALKPTRPTPAKLLPAVHGIWPMLLAALQDTGSVSLLEQQLGLLALLIQLAGGKFMARRFQRDAWPLLQRLLKAGPQAGAAALAASTASSTVGGGAAVAALMGVGAGPGSDGRDPLGLPGRSRPAASGSSDSSGGSVFGSALSSMQATAGARSSLDAATGSMVSSDSAAADEGGPIAPATLQRVQLAVLGCLTGLAGSRTAAAALQGPLVWDICVLTAPYLADGQALALREAAAKLLVAAADVDADAVWLLLLDLGSCCQDACQLLPSGVESQHERLPLSAAASGAAVDAAGVGVLHKLQQLLVPVDKGLKAGGRTNAGDSGWRKLLGSSEGASCGRRAAALLPRVAAASVSWHEKAEQQLKVLQGAA